MLLRIRDNPHMSRPHNQVTGLRAFYALKILVARVQIEGACVRIRKSGASVDFMHKVGTIQGGSRRGFVLPRNGNNLVTFFGTYKRKARSGLRLGTRGLAARLRSRRAETGRYETKQ